MKNCKKNLNIKFRGIDSKMDEKFLRKIYFDYYDIGKLQNFKLNTDVEYIQFLANYKKVKARTLNATFKNFKEISSKKLRDSVLNSNDKDDYFIDKNFIHITYPFQKTINRLDVIYKTIRRKEWERIFGFKYKNMIALIYVIIGRIVSYNNMVLSNKGKEYKFYFTKDEIYTYLTISNKEIDKIMKFISIELDKISTERDCFNIINFSNNKYTLIFIWDFLYYLYDKIEMTIKENYDEKQLNTYYNMRGKVFEKQCAEEIELSFKNKEIYKNAYYLNKKGKNELDIILIINNKIIVFECKTTKFDIYKTNNNEELEYEIIDALGKGYKTINNFDEYIKDKDILELFYNGNKYEIDLKNKDIIYICVSLNNIEFVQTSIQKLDGKVLKKVNKYPIILNYLDFSSILELASLNPTLILKYFSERYFTINELKMLSLDIDEIDVLGFLTDDQNERVYKMIKECASNVDTNIMIKNEVYRNQLNEFLNRKFFYDLYNMQ